MPAVRCCTVLMPDLCTLRVLYAGVLVVRVDVPVSFPVAAWARSRITITNNGTRSRNRHAAQPVPLKIHRIVRNEHGRHRHTRCKKQAPRPGHYRTIYYIAASYTYTMHCSVRCLVAAGGEATERSHIFHGHYTYSTHGV